MVTKKRCRFTNIPFLLTADDLKFYENLGVPQPSLYPQERMRRRLSFRNEATLHKRRCSATHAQIISMYAKDCPIPVFDNDYWWSDSWDAKLFARDYDFSRSFFDQFRELLYVTPKMARIQQGENVNSKFCNCASNNKNCHLIFSSNTNEDCLYGRILLNCRDCIDCLAAYNCELCAHCIQCENCFGGIYLENCKGCSDSWFLQNCIGCHHCFGSINLRNQSYCFFNEHLSPEAYTQKVAAVKLSSHQNLERFKDQFYEYAQGFPWRSYQGVNNENVSGDYITNSRDAIVCFDVDNVESCKYCDSVSQLKDCYDVSYYGATGSNELLYECEGVGHGTFNIVASKLIWGGSSYVYHSYECFNSHHLLGCCGLKKAEYCIFNKQFSKSDYEILFNRIRDQMLKIGEWGEFFPTTLSPFGYNETVAHEHFQLLREEVLKRGWKWRDEQYPTKPDTQYQIPDVVSTVKDEITKQTLFCEVSGMPYRIEQSELEFCRKMEIPIPRLSPIERHKYRRSRRGSRILEETICKQCKNPVTSAWTKHSYTLLCEECYPGCI